MNTVDTGGAAAPPLLPGGGPLVVACVRVTDARPDVDPLTGQVQRDARGAGLSPSDAAALEHALRVAEAWSGSVLVVSAGPVGAEPALREAAALGARVVRLGRPAATGHGGATQEPLGSAQDYLADLVRDERALAAALAATILAAGTPALVLCGDRSVDRGTGALPAYLAHELGAAQALGLVSLTAASDGTLRGERRLDAGRREVLRIPRPAVCSVEAAGVRLRRAPLAAAVAASAGSVPLVVAAPHGEPDVHHDGGRPYRPRPRVVAPPSGSTPRSRLLDLTGALVTHDPPTLIGPVDAPEAVDALLGFLRRHGYLPAPD